MCPSSSTLTEYIDESGLPVITLKDIQNLNTEQKLELVRSFIGSYRTRWIMEKTGLPRNRIHRIRSGKTDEISERNLEIALDLLIDMHSGSIRLEFRMSDREDLKGPKGD